MHASGDLCAVGEQSFVRESADFETKRDPIKSQVQNEIKRTNERQYLRCELLPLFESYARHPSSNDSLLELELIKMRKGSRQ